MKGSRSRKLTALLAAYKGQAALNATEAARLAGYAFPEQATARLKKRFPELFEKAEQEFRESLRMSPEELDERITSLARNSKHKDHYKALELIARMYGKLSEKVHVTLDRGSLNGQLDSMLAMLLKSRASATNITIETAEVALLPAITTDETTTN